MRKYLGYVIFIGGLILLIVQTYSLFYYSNLYNTMPNCAYNDFECLQMKHYIGHHMLRGMAWAFFGLIITYWGWKTLHKPKCQIKDDKELIKNTENATNRFLEAVPKYTSIISYPHGKVKIPKPQSDDYMEKITILNILKEKSKTTREDIKNLTNFDDHEIDLAIKDLVDEEKIIDFGNKFQIR